MNWLLLIIPGGIAAMIAPPLVAIYLCERHSRQHGPAHAAAARVAVEAAERHAAARRAANRPKELTR